MRYPHRAVRVIWSGKRERILKLYTRGLTEDKSAVFADPINSHLVGPCCHTLKYIQSTSVNTSYNDILQISTLILNI